MSVNNLTLFLIMFAILNQFSFQVTTAASITPETLMNDENSLQSSKSSYVNSLDTIYPEQMADPFDSLLSEYIMVPKISTQQQQLPTATRQNLLNDELELFSTSR